MVLTAQVEATRSAVLRNAQAPINPRHPLQLLHPPSPLRLLHPLSLQVQLVRLAGRVFLQGPLALVIKAFVAVEDAAVADLRLVLRSYY